MSSPNEDPASGSIDIAVSSDAPQQQMPELIKRLKNQPGVRGVVVATRFGKSIYATLNEADAKTAAQVGAATFEAVRRAMEPMDDSDPVFLRIRTKQHAYLMVEEDDFILVCQEEL